MPTYTWDDAFEADPADLDEAKYGAQEIRELKVAISERGELEHNFKAGTQPFHKGGKCSVVFSGTTAEINALTSMGGDTANVTLAWDETLKVLKVYNGSSWSILDIDHGQLSGKSDDDHTQYLNLTKASQTLTQNLSVSSGKTIDGRDISADGAALDALSIAYGTGFGAWTSLGSIANNTSQGPETYDCFISITMTASTTFTVDFYISTNGSSWTSIAQKASFPSGYTGEEHFLIPVPATNYWKINATKFTSATAYKLTVT